MVSEDRPEFTKMRPYFRCFDHRNVVIANNLQSSEHSSLRISFSIPDELCRDDEEDIECIPDYSYNHDAMYKSIVVLQNRQRFE